MASAPPDPDELHKLTIVLDGKRLGKGKSARATKYYAYMKQLRKLVENHGGQIHSKELHLKQSVINARKRKLKKARGRGRKNG